jgi:LemA protein
VRLAVQFLSIVVVGRQGTSVSTPQIVLIAVAMMLGFWFVGAYNRLVRLRNAIGVAFASLDVQLRHRHDLCAMMARTAGDLDGPDPQAMREVIEAIVAAANQAHAAVEVARTRPTASSLLKSLSVAEHLLRGALARLEALLQAPLSAASNAALAEQFAQMEAARAQLAFTTQAFNHAVADYNAAARQFPTLIVCALFGFGHAAPLEA